VALPEHDVGAEAVQFARHKVSRDAAGTVGEDAHIIDGFGRCSRDDKDVRPRKRAA
jgi:hypothetical protein